VAKHPVLKLQITGPARRDIAAIAKWSLREFGEAAAMRYRTLIRQALLDIEADPERPGSDKRPELMIEGVRTYHLSFSRGRAGRPGVKDPRHFLLYRCRGDVIEVARIIHDARDLEQHLPPEYRRSD
jgi:toxin ParE1/3/4